MINFTDYGKVVREYAATGIVTIGQGPVTIQNARSRLIQYADGRIYLSCSMGQLSSQWGPGLLNTFQDIARRFTVNNEHDLEKAGQRGVSGNFSGITSDGLHITVTELHLIRSVQSMRPVGDDVHVTLTWTFLCSNAELSRDSTEMPTQLRFSLVNLEFSDGQLESSPGFRVYQSHPPSLEEIQRPLQIGECAVSVVPVAHYYDIIQTLKVTQGVDVTCTAEITITPDVDVDTVKGYMHDLCLILTLARGTRVDWINFDQLSVSGEILRTTLRYSPIAKRFGANYLVDPASITLDKMRLNAAFPRLAQAKADWNIEPVIGLFNDAKVEGDLLFARGLKAVVCMEMLAKAYKDRQQMRGLIVPKSVFRRLHRRIREVIAEVLQTPLADEGETPAEAEDMPQTTSQNESANQATMLESNVQNLNYYSLRPAILGMFQEVGFTSQRLDDDTRKFVKIRNELVHQGQFHPDHALLGTPIEQLNFLLKFVAIFLSAVLFYIEHGGHKYWLLW